MRQLMGHIAVLPRLGAERIEDDNCLATNVECAGREGECLKSIELSESFHLH